MPGPVSQWQLPGNRRGGSARGQSQGHPLERRFLVTGEVILRATSKVILQWTAPRHRWGHPLGHRSYPSHRWGHTLEHSLQIAGEVILWNIDSWSQIRLSSETYVGSSLQVRSSSRTETWSQMLPITGAQCPSRCKVILWNTDSWSKVKANVLWNTDSRSQVRSSRETQAAGQWLGNLLELRLMVTCEVIPFGIQIPDQNGVILWITSFWWQASQTMEHGLLFTREGCSSLEHRLLVTGEVILWNTGRWSQLTLIEPTPEFERTVKLWGPLSF